MLRAVVLLPLSFALLAHQSISSPITRNPTQVDHSEKQSNTSEERFGISSSLSLGVNPELGFGAAGGGGNPNAAYPTFNIGSSVGGGFGYPAGGSIGGGVGGFNSGIGAGYAPNYNGGAYGTYPTSYNVNNGYNSYPPRYSSYSTGFSPDYNYGGFGDYGGGAWGYGSSAGYDNGFLCGSMCGTHLRRCSTACSKDFWTYLCVLCIGPKWDSCRGCFM